MWVLKLNINFKRNILYQGVSFVLSQFTKTTDETRGFLARFNLQLLYLGGDCLLLQNNSTPMWVT